jgi:hypothetical protein
MQATRKRCWKRKEMKMLEMDVSAEGSWPNNSNPCRDCSKMRKNMVEIMARKESDGSCGHCANCQPEFFPLSRLTA